MTLAHFPFNSAASVPTKIFVPMWTSHQMLFTAWWTVHMWSHFSRTMAADQWTNVLFSSLTMSHTQYVRNVELFYSKVCVLLMHLTTFLLCKLKVCVAFKIQHCLIHLIKVWGQMITNKKMVICTLETCVHMCFLLQSHQFTWKIDVACMRPKTTDWWQWSSQSQCQPSGITDSVCCMPFEWMPIDPNHISSDFTCQHFSEMGKSIDLCLSSDSWILIWSWGFLLSTAVMLCPVQLATIARQHHCLSWESKFLGPNGWFKDQKDCTPACTMERVPLMVGKVASVLCTNVQQWICLDDSQHPWSANPIWQWLFQFDSFCFKAMQILHSLCSNGCNMCFHQTRSNVGSPIRLLFGQRVGVLAPEIGMSWFGFDDWLHGNWSCMIMPADPGKTFSMWLDISKGMLCEIATTPFVFVTHPFEKTKVFHCAQWSTSFVGQTMLTWNAGTITEKERESHFLCATQTICLKFPVSLGEVGDGRIPADKICADTDDDDVVPIVRP